MLPSMPAADVSAQTSSLSPVACADHSSLVILSGGFVPRARPCLSRSCSTVTSFFPIPEFVERVPLVVLPSPLEAVTVQL